VASLFFTSSSSFCMLSTSAMIVAMNSYHLSTGRSFEDFERCIWWEVDSVRVAVWFLSVQTEGKTTFTGLFARGLTG
jgi:hypothetical protein